MSSVMNNLYENKSINVLVTQTEPSFVMFMLPTNYSDTYAKHLISVGGAITSQTPYMKTWKIPVSQNSKQVIRAILNTDLKYMEIIAPAATLPSSSPFRQMPTPTIGGTAYPSTLQGAGSQNPFSGMAATLAATSAYTPPVQPVRTAKPVIASGQSPGWWLYDYSPASLALFFENTALTQQMTPKIIAIGGKGASLYPDGQERKQGFIFAKSNDKAVDGLTQMTKVNIREVGDFSKVKKRNWAPRGGAQQGAFAPQVVSGPGFLPATASTPLAPPGGMAMPPTGGMSSGMMMAGLSGVPDVTPESKLSNFSDEIENILRASPKETVTHEESDEILVLHGTKESIEKSLATIDHTEIIWDFTSKDQRIVKIRQGKIEDPAKEE